MVLIRREFVLDAPQPRVWDLIATTILQSLPVTQTEIVNDSTLRGILRLKLGFIEWPLPLQIEVSDIVPMSRFATRVTVGEGLLRAVLNVAYELTDLEDDRTRIACCTTIEQAPRWMTLVRWQQRRFAAQMFDAVHVALERAC